MSARLLNVAQTAEQLGVSKAKLWEWVRDRRIVSVKVDHMRRFRQEDIDAFIAGLTDDRPQEASA